MEEEKLVCAENCPHLNKINNVKSLEPKADEYQNYLICLNYFQMKLD